MNPLNCILLQKNAIGGMIPVAYDVKENCNLPARADIFNHPAKRLKSRNSVRKSLDTELNTSGNQWLKQ